MSKTIFVIAHIMEEALFYQYILLKYRNAQVHVFDNTVTLFEACFNQLPDLLLIARWSHDGADLCRQLRETFHLPQFPIIAGWVMSKQDYIDAFQIGVNACFSLNNLNTVLKQVDLLLVNPYLTGLSD